MTVKAGLMAIRSFVAVAESGGFRRAASDLGLAPASVSQHISTLEGELGLKLFNRTTRSVQLTDVGQSYFDQCQRVFKELDEITDGAKTAFTQPSGLLRISVSGSFGRFVATPLIMRFVQTNPLVEADIVLTGQFVDVYADAIDIAIKIGTPRVIEPMGIKHFAPVRRILCASPRYIEDHGAPVEPQDLGRHLCIVRSHRPLDRLWRLYDEAGDEHPVRVNGRLSANETELMLDGCLAGLGIAFLPEVLAQPYLTDGRLVRVLENHRPADGDLHATYRADHLISPKVRLCLEFLEQEFDAVLDPAQRA